MVPRQSAGARSYREADRDGIFAEDSRGVEICGYKLHE